MRFNSGFKELKYSETERVYVVCCMCVVGKHPVRVREVVYSRKER